MTAATCSQCGAAFSCGRDDPNGCWCSQLPPLDAASLNAAHDCLCERCLVAQLGHGAMLRAARP